MTRRTRADAYTESVRRDIAELSDELVKGLGATVVAAITGTQRSTPYRWASKAAAPERDAETRLRFAYRVWRMLADAEGESVALAWIVGANPRLGEVTPVTAMREQRDTDVVGAANAFINDVPLA